MDYGIFGLSQYQAKAMQSQVSLLQHNQEVKDYIVSVLARLYAEIDKIPDVCGAGVCYVDTDNNVIEFRKAKSSNDVRPIYIVLRESIQSLTPSKFASYIKEAQGKPREGRLAHELSSLFFNCTPVVIGWIVAGVAATTVPITAGATSFIAFSAGAGAIAGTASCAISIGRTATVLAGSGEKLDILDDEVWYSTMSASLDVISLAGSGAVSIQIFQHIRSLMKAGYNYMDILKSLNYAQRARLTKEVIRIKNPRVDNMALKKMIRSPSYPKAFENSVFRGEVMKKISDAVSVAFSVAASRSSGVLKPNWQGHFALGVVAGEDL